MVGFDAFDALDASRVVAGALTTGMAATAVCFFFFEVAVALTPVVAAAPACFFFDLGGKKTSTKTRVKEDRLVYLAMLTLHKVDDLALSSRTAPAGASFRRWSWLVRGGRDTFGLGWSCLSLLGSRTS